MAKKRKGAKKIESKQDGNNEEVERTQDPDPNSDDYFHDDIDKFHLEKDKITFDDDAEESELETDDEEEVMGLDDTSDEDENDYEDDDDDVELSDDEDGDDSDIDSDSLEGEGKSNVKAWGKSKNLFYNTDLIDEDMLGSDEEAELAAQEEEEEALSMQKMLASKLTEDDFDAFSMGQVLPDAKGDGEQDGEATSQIIKDLSSLSKEEKLELLIRESPELFEMLDEFKDRLTEVVDTFHPLLMAVKKGIPISNEGRFFIEVKHQALLNYCVNVNFYLLLKANKELSKTHPIIARLVQYREIMLELDKVSHSIKNEISDILQSNSKSSQITEKAPATKINKKTRDDIIKRKRGTKLKVKNEDAIETVSDPMDYYNKIKEETEQRKLAKLKMKENRTENDSDDEEELEGKRGITNEMQKNKGLTRSRRKDIKNPRVKHKLKFKKAVVRRKGQVRAVVKELQRYGGETTGIKANLTRSVKIK